MNCHTCGNRKSDCLAPYVNLRRISNSSEGFKGNASGMYGWSDAEKQFYISQMKRQGVQGY